MGGGPDFRSGHATCRALAARCRGCGLVRSPTAAQRRAFRNPLDRRDRRVVGLTGAADPAAAEEEGDGRARAQTACTRAAEDLGSGVEAFDYSYVGLTEQLSRENRNGRVQTYDYTASGERLGRLKGSGSSKEWRAYDTDAQGSVVGLEKPSTGETTPDADGELNTYETDPFGAPVGKESDVTDDAAQNPFRFQGFYNDPETGTYDMQARAYQPSTGRFLQQHRFEDPEADLLLASDPLTSSRYAFTAGNPGTRSEYDGHQFPGQTAGGAKDVNKRKAAAAGNEEAAGAVARRSDRLRERGYTDEYDIPRGGGYTSAVTERVQGGVTTSRRVAAAVPGPTAQPHYASVSTPGGTQSFCVSGACPQGPRPDTGGELYDAFASLASGFTGGAVPATGEKNDSLEDAGMAAGLIGPGLGRQVLKRGAYRSAEGVECRLADSCRRGRQQAATDRDPPRQQHSSGHRRSAILGARLGPHAGSRHPAECSGGRHQERQVSSGPRWPHRSLQRRRAIQRHCRAQWKRGHGQLR